MLYQFATGLLETTAVGAPAARPVPDQENAQSTRRGDGDRPRRARSAVRGAGSRSRTTTSSSGSGPRSSSSGSRAPPSTRSRCTRSRTPCASRRTSCGVGGGRPGPAPRRRRRAERRRRRRRADRRRERRRAGRALPRQLRRRTTRASRGARRASSSSRPGRRCFSMFKPELRDIRQAGAREARRRGAAGRASSSRDADPRHVRVRATSSRRTPSSGVRDCRRTRHPDARASSSRRATGSASSRISALAGHPEVFAVGDIAWITDAKTKQVLPQLGSVALQAGEHAGENIARRVAGKDDRSPSPTSTRARWRRSGAAPPSCSCRGADDEGQDGVPRVGSRPPALPADRRGPGQGDRQLDLGRGSRHERAGRITREAERSETVMADGTAGRRAGDLRDHRRPREGDDVPVAVPARAARAARLPDRRRRGRRLDGRPAASSAPATSIVGTGEQLDEAVFDRLAARLSYVAGDFADAATYERVGARDQGHASSRSSTSRSRRSCSARWSRGSPRPG